MALYRQSDAAENLSTAQKLSKSTAEKIGTSEHVLKKEADRYQQAIDNTVELFQDFNKRQKNG